jgi:hypothetical protein
MDTGYGIYPDVIAVQECDELLEALTEASRSKRAGTRHLMSNPAVQSLAHDVQLLRVASNFVGASAVPFRATLFSKTEQANWLIAWHQDLVLPMEEPFDSAGWGLWSIKGGIHCVQAPAWALSRMVALRIHLDDSTLRFWPAQTAILTSNALLPKEA